MAAKHTSVKQKIALSFLRVAALLSALIFIVIALVLFPKVWQLELHNIKQDLLRTINTLEQEVANIGYHADDWANWDDTYHYLAGEAPGYQRSNLTDESLLDAKLDFISLTTLEGEIVWGRYLKPEGEERRYSGAPTASGLWPKLFISELSKHPNGMNGYFSSRFGVLCFAARPVLTTDRKGPPRGWFITGRWLNENFTTRVNRQMQQTVIFHPQQQDEGENFDQHLKGNIQFYIDKLSLTEIRAKALIRDYKNDPVFTLTLDEERIIFIESSQAMLIAFIGLILAGGFCSWFLYRRVQEVILEPLSNLTSSMEQLGNTQALALNCNFNHNDEISLLYQKYHEVTDKLLKAQKALEKRSNLLEIESLTDPLTKLHNRRYLERLVPMISENPEHAPGKKKLLLIIDIDYFKAMNDTFGHTTGDAILVQLSSLLKSIFHPQDHIIRMGGEEFLVIADCRGEQHNIELAERVRRSVEEFSFTADQSEPLAVTVSIGFSRFPLSLSHQPGQSWQTIMQLADYALYQAKSAGRNRWCGFYAEPSITDNQLAMIPDQVDKLVESQILRRFVSKNQ